MCRHSAALSIVLLSKRPVSEEQVDNREPIELSERQSDFMSWRGRWLDPQLFQLPLVRVMALVGAVFAEIVTTPANLDKGLARGVTPVRGGLAPLARCAWCARHCSVSHRQR